jgi:DNA-binding transcriptional ArsR family regulator
MPVPALREPEDRVFAALASPVRREVLRLLRERARAPWAA